MILGGRYYYYPHLIDQGTEAQRNLSKLPKSQLVSDWLGWGRRQGLKTH